MQPISETFFRKIDQEVFRDVEFGDSLSQLKF